MLAGEFIASVRDDDQKRQRIDRLREEAEQITGCGIRPMQIIEQEHDRMLSGERSKKVQHLPEERRLTCHCADLPRLAEGWRERRSPAGLISLEQIEPRAVCGRLGEVEAAPHQHTRTLLR